MGNRLGKAGGLNCEPLKAASASAVTAQGGISYTIAVGLFSYLRFVDAEHIL